MTTASDSTSFEGIVKQIKELPPLPESVKKIQSLFNAGDPSLKELIKLIEQDPILTSDILGKINSPMYGFSKQIISVSQAVTLLGTATVRGFVLSYAMNQTLKLDMEPYGISNETFNTLCKMQSALMFQWYTTVSMERMKILAPLAFIVEIGKVIVASEVVKINKVTQFKEKIKSPLDIAKIETWFFNATSSEVTSLLFKEWYFDDTFIDLMKYMDDPKQAPVDLLPCVQALNVVQKAINVRAILTDASIEEALKEVKRLGLDGERFLKTAKRLQAC